MEDYFHSLVTTRGEWFPTVRLNGESYINRVNHQVLRTTDERHLLHLLGNLALNAIVGNVNVTHHFKDALLGLAGDTILIARKDKNFIIGQFLTCLLDFFKHREIIVRAIDVCTADILCRCLCTRIRQEMNGLQHIMSFDEFKIQFP